MKKIVKILIVAFILALLITSLSVSAFALSIDDEPVLLENTGAENTDNYDGEETEEKFYSKWLEKLTDSTLWINICATLAGLLGVIAFLKSNLKKIKNNVGTLLNGHISYDMMQKLIKSSMSTLEQEYATNFDEMKKKIEAQNESEKTLLSILTIFITNAKINTCAKTEIMNLLTGVKGTLNTVEETVVAANKAISDALAQEEKTETPAIDKVIEEVKNEEPNAKNEEQRDESEEVEETPTMALE